MATSSLVPWIRLIRYISPDGSTKYGEPILPSPTDDPTTLFSTGSLQIRPYTGTDPFTAQPSTGEPESATKLLGPLTPTQVPQIICVGINYKSHIHEAGLQLPKNPILFTKPSPAVHDHDASIPIAKIAQEKADYEGELVVVIGKDCKNVSVEEALGYVAGYTSGNDVSARDWQIDPEKAGSMPQATFSKSFDYSAPLGPCLVSTSVLGDASDLSLKTVVNGEVRQQGNTNDLCFGVKQLVSFCSQGHTLQKGTLIMTGTPSGVGLFMKPPQFLKEGDTVEVTFGGIGTLRNTIEFEK